MLFIVLLGCFFFPAPVTNEVGGYQCCVAVQIVMVIYGNKLRLTVFILKKTLAKKLKEISIKKLCPVATYTKNPPPISWSKRLLSWGSEGKLRASTSMIFSHALSLLSWHVPDAPTVSRLIILHWRDVSRAWRCLNWSQFFPRARAFTGIWMKYGVAKRCRYLLYSFRLSICLPEMWYFLLPIVRSHTLFEEFLQNLGLSSCQTTHSRILTRFL